MLRRLAPVLLALALLPALAHAQVSTRNLTLTDHADDFPPPTLQDDAYSACWSYIHPDGREYAVIGINAGTAFYNVTDPYNVYQVGVIPGPPSLWREIKSYRNWVYMVTEGNGAGEGLQIVRMTNPEAPVLVNTYTTTFRRAHTVSVDTARAILICNGTTNALGQANGMRILSLANPEAPVEIAHWPNTASPISSTNYIHDSVPIGSRLFGSSIYAGIQRVFDFTNPAAPVQINQWTYTGGFSHNAWPDATGNVLYVTDEVNGEPLKVFDISNVMSPVLGNAISSNPQAIVHNAHVLGNELYLSNYTEGIRILDISDPLHPAEFAYADSWPGQSGNFFGVWEVCPYFPSGTVIASDMQSGLYVYRPVREYGIIRAVVTTPDAAVGADACGSDPGGVCCCYPDVCSCGGGPGDHLMAAASGVEVFLTTQGDSLLTPADGIVQFAPNPGVHTVTARKFGYYDASATVTVATGSRDTVQLALVPRLRQDLAGEIRDQVTDAPLEAAEINFLYTGAHVHTNAAGQFALSQFPEDTYQVEVRAPGHIPTTFTLTLTDSTPPLNLKLPPSLTWDAFEAASGWVTGGAGTGDNATTGQWVRVEPLGTGAQQPTSSGARLAFDEGSASTTAFAVDRAGASQRGAYENSVVRSSADPLSLLPKPGPGLFHEGHEEDGVAPGDVQPEFDRTPPTGTLCFITGQGTTPSSIGEADVDNGKTSLTSPALDLRNMTDPVIGYWRWFSASGGADDWFAVLISNDNGTNWTAVDTLRGSQAHWYEQAIHVKNYFASPSAVMKVRFIAADQNPGSVVEAGIDDVVTYDAEDALLVDVPNGAAPHALRFRATFPNPGQGSTRFALELPVAADATVEVLDVTGRRVKLLHRGTAPAGLLSLAWDGTDDGGNHVAAGFYFARAQSRGQKAITRFARL